MTFSPTVAHIRLHSLHAGQKRVLAEAKRFNWLCAGRRWRKTSLCASLCIDGHRQWRGAAEGHSWLWAAPVADQVRIGWDEMKTACHSVTDIIQFHETHRTVYFPDGGKIFFRSLDNPNSTRGLTITGGAVIDEYQDAPAEAWSRVIQPMMIDTGGCAFMLFTPRGHNHAYQHWQAAGDDPNQARWQVPLLGAVIDQVTGDLIRKPNPYENPAIRWGDLLSIWNDPTMDERTFRQEYLAEFLADGGGVFRGERVEASMTAPPGATPDPSVEYVMGADIGRHHDFTWLRIFNARTQVEVLSERWSGLDYAIQRGRLLAIIRAWRPVTIAMEINGNEAFVEDLAGTPLVEPEDGKPTLDTRYIPIFPVKMTNPTKATMIADLTLAFERGDIALLPDPIALAELTAFEGQRSKNSTVTLYGAPDGMHDDGVMSLALAWHALIKGRVIYAGGLW